MTSPAPQDDRKFPIRPLIGVGTIVFSTAGVLLIQRGKPPRQGSWSLPGGAQDVGETVRETARREVREETGLEVEIVDIVDVVDSITRSTDGRVEYHYTLIDFVAHCDLPDAARAGGDAADVKWVNPSDIPSLGLWSETARVIAEAEKIWRARGFDR